MYPFLQRMTRAACLDAQFYADVAADPSTMSQALTVVALSSLAAGLASLHMGLIGIALGTLAALARWLIWTGVIYLVGTRLFPEPQTRADYGQLLRTTGFSTASGVLLILGVLPLLRGAVVLATSIWMLLAMIVAVRQALASRSNWRVVGVCLLGWITQAALLAPLIRMASPE